MNHMTSADDEAQQLQADIFRMVTAFRRQRGEFLVNGSLTVQSKASIAARHMGAAEKISADGPLTVGALAELLGVDMTTASRIATELEEAEIVQRQRDPGDRRRILLEVAPEHRERINAFMSDLRSPLIRTVKQLSPEELAGFHRGLTLYAEELNAEDQASPPEAPS